MKRECEEYKVLNSVSHIYLKLLNLMTELNVFWKNVRKKISGKKFWSFIFTFEAYGYT